MYTVYTAGGSKVKELLDEELKQVCEDLIQMHEDGMFPKRFNVRVLRLICESMCGTFDSSGTERNILWEAARRWCEVPNVYV